MADKNNQTGAAEQENLSQLLQIRRDKLKQLQEGGNDPFTITRYVADSDSARIKENFDALEGKEVSVAGRLMSKRGMGKVSFCDLQDKSGRIQLYARKDEMDEAEYNRFKKYVASPRLPVSWLSISPCRRPCRWPATCPRTTEIGRAHV